MGKPLEGSLFWATISPGFHPHFTTAASPPQSLFMSTQFRDPLPGQSLATVGKFPFPDFCHSSRCRSIFQVGWIRGLLTNTTCAIIPTWHLSVYCLYSWAVFQEWHKGHLAGVWGLHKPLCSLIVSLLAWVWPLQVLPQRASCTQIPSPSASPSCSWWPVRGQEPWSMLTTLAN